MTGVGIILIVVVGAALLWSCVAAVIWTARWVNIQRAAAFDRDNRAAVEREMAQFGPIWQSEQRRLRDLQRGGGWL